METLGYVPHAGAQAMKTRRTNTIGVVVADLTNPFYPEVLDELSRELDAAGFRVVIWNAGGGSHHDALKAIREHAVDGVIFTTATEDSLELQAAIEKNSPIVLINRVVEGLECDQVTSSNTEGGAAVADYLLAHGKTRVAFIGGAENASTSRERGQGFLGRMADRAMPFPSTSASTAGFPTTSAPRSWTGCCPAPTGRRPSSAPTTTWPSAPWMPCVPTGSSPGTAG